MVTNGAPHIPLSGSACNACLLYCAVDFIEFTACVQVEHLADLLCSCKVERKREKDSTVIWSCKAYKADKFFNLLMKESNTYTACGKVCLSS
jgi:hypothetical protein